MTNSIFTDEELEAADGLLPQEPPLAEETPVNEPARDEQGRFAPKDDAAEEPQADQDEGEEKPRQRTVPQEALHAERQRRKAVEEELNRAREAIEAINKMREAVAARAPEPLPIVDDTGTKHLRARVEQLAANQNHLAQRADMEVLAQQEAQQLGAVMVQSEQVFRSVKPDYDDAINHVVQARARELQLYGLNPVEVDSTIRSEVADIVRSAVKMGRNPAEMGYEIAMARGYRPAVQTEQGAPPETVNNGAMATVAALKTAQASAKSVGSASGGRTQQLNIESIAAMTPEEFDALYSTPEGKKLVDSL